MAGNATFIQLPNDVSDPTQLRRFLDKLVEQLDISFGNRGDSEFVSSDTFISNATSVQDLVNSLEVEALKYSKVDGSRPFTGPVSYEDSVEVTTDSNELLSCKLAGTLFEPAITKGSLATLNMVVSDPPTTTEVQAISDKVDELINYLISTKLILN